jgi:hypothetical protein
MIERLLAGQEQMRAKRNAKLDAFGDKLDTETKAIKARTKVIPDKLDAHQEKPGTGLKPQETENKTDLEETEATNLEANREKTEPSPGEKEAVKKRHENPNEEVAVHSLRECQRETMACQETTEADIEKIEPNPRRKKRSKGSRRQATAIPEKEEGSRVQHRRVELKTAVTPGKRRNAQEGPI